MKIRSKVIIIIIMLLSYAYANTETIVLFRHAEKQPQGLGLLNCKGLNRSLQLTNYLVSHFGKPNYIFVPNPSIKVYEKSTSKKFYSYTRPLLTIGPTAIKLGVPIDTQVGYNHPRLLIEELLQPKYHDATIYVVWEHLFAKQIAELLLQEFKVDAKVPPWENSDYDTIYIFKINWDVIPARLNFKIEKMQLKNIKSECPVS